MVMLSLAKQLGIRTVKFFGDTIANGLKDARCPSKFRQLAVNLAQANHRAMTRMQRRLHGFESDVPIHPLDEEKAVQAGALLLAELSVYTAAAVAVFQVQRIISETKEERRIQELQALKAELASAMEFHAEKLDHKGKQVEFLEQKQAKHVNWLGNKSNLQLNWLESKLTAELVQKQEQLAIELVQKQEQLAVELTRKQEQFFAAKLAQKQEQLVAELAPKQERLVAELAQKQEHLATEFAAKIVDEFKELRQLTTLSVILNAHSWQ